MEPRNANCADSCAAPLKPSGVCEMAGINRKRAMSALDKAERIRNILAGGGLGEDCEKQGEPGCLLMDLKQGGAYLSVLEDCLDSILEILG